MKREVASQKPVTNLYSEIKKMVGAKASCLTSVEVTKEMRTVMDKKARKCVTKRVAKKKKITKKKVVKKNYGQRRRTGT